MNDIQALLHKRLLLLLMSSVALLFLPSPAMAQEASHRCEDYATQQDAQAAFDRDPGRLWELDDDGDGIACEHLPAAAGDSSLFPWIAGGVLVTGAAAGVLLARRRTSPSRPQSTTTPSIPVNTHPEYDPEVELELELIKAEQADDDQHPQPPRSTQA